MALPDPGRSRILLIGAARYADPGLADLPAVAGNLADLAAVLTDPGYGAVAPDSCTTVLDPPGVAGLYDTMCGLAREAASLFLVYYAGHGLLGPGAGEFYLALPGSRADDPYASALEFAGVRRAMLSCPARVRVVVLDCCFSGQAINGVMGAGGRHAAGQLDIAGTYVLTATPPNKLAMAPPGNRNTVFTGMLLSVLREGLRGPALLSMDDIYRQVRHLAVARGLPEPQCRVTATAGDFPLVRNRYPARGEGDGESARDPLQGRAGADGGPRPASGRGGLLFRARVEHPAGQLTVGFGAGNTLVVAEKNGAVHRWSLPEGTGLAGMPPGEPLPSGISVAVSTAVPAIAIARVGKLTVVHFGQDGYTTTDMPLGRNEFLVTACGERFATYDGRQVTVRDFGDGSVLWQQPCPPHMATAAIDHTGTAIAIASGANLFAGSSKIRVVAQDRTGSAEFSFDNIPFGAGCQVALSAGGSLVACASFREVILASLSDRQILQRRRLSGWRQEVVPALGARPQRLICTPAGQVLWLRGRRIALVRWDTPDLRYLPQDGACDDIALDPLGSRLAIVSQSGQVDVWQWHDEDTE